MNVGLVITPSGQLRIENAPESLPEVSESAAAALEGAFAKSSARGLVLLASHALDSELPAALVFWRGLARRFFQAVCHEGEGAFEKWASIPPPPDEELEQ